MKRLTRKRKNPKIVVATRFEPAQADKIVASGQIAAKDGPLLAVQLHHPDPVDVDILAVGPLVCLHLVCDCHGGDCPESVRLEDRLAASALR